MPIEVRMDGVTLPVEGFRENGTAFVPLDTFCKLVGAEAKVVDGVGLAVCRDDLCVPLGDGERIRERDGVKFAAIEAFGEALGLAWRLDGEKLSVTSTSGAKAREGTRPGDVAPAFILPDLFTGSAVSSRDFLGKKTVFYAWASW